MINTKIFALDCKSYANAIAQNLNITISPHEEFFHPDDETYIRSLENVRRCRVFIVAHLYTDEYSTVDQKIMKLMLFAGALRDASADDITLVSPYLPYARADRKVKSREGVITRYLAQMLESVGIDRILTIDIHNLGAFQNAYHKARVDNLEAKNLFADYIARELSDVNPEDITVFSPDAGGVGRAKRFRKALSKLMGNNIKIAFFDKERDGKEVSGENIIGQIAPVVIMLDDIIGTGKSVCQCLNPIRDKGGKQIYLSATHGLFVGDANKYLANDLIHKIIITDSVRPFRLDDDLARQKLTVIDTTNLFSNAILNTYTGNSLSKLFE